MRVALLGVRGSTPAPGADFIRYGGHTSCIAVFADGDSVTDSAPRLVLDAGTGLRSLPALLDGRPFRGDIVLTHLHWDHLQGLPFCPSVDHPEAEVRLHVPVETADDDPVALLARTLSPPHFPIGPDGLLGRWRFLPLRPGRIGEFVTVATVEHKGGIAYGIRVELDGATLAYLPDHLLTGAEDEASEAAERLVDGADLLLHDGSFVGDEVDVARDYGHATIEAAMDFADRCRVGELVLTHHAPGRSDSALDDLATRYRSTAGGRPVRFARQDTTLGVAGLTGWSLPECADGCGDDFVG